MSRMVRVDKDSGFGKETMQRTKDRAIKVLQDADMDTFILVSIGGKDGGLMSTVSTPQDWAIMKYSFEKLEEDLTRQFGELVMEQLKEFTEAVKQKIKEDGLL